MQSKSELMEGSVGVVFSTYIYSYVLIYMGWTWACCLSVVFYTSHSIGGLSDVDFVRCIWHSLHYIYSTFVKCQTLKTSSDLEQEKDNTKLRLQART